MNPRPGKPWQLGAFRIHTEARCAGGVIGGDFYAFRLRAPKRLAVVIGDACGHGPEGAKLLPHVLAPLDELSLAISSPRLLLEALNRNMAGRMACDRFVTGAALELDAERGTLTVANAGHVPLMLRQATGRVSVLGRASGPPLGMLPHSKYTEQSHSLASGDVVVFMTDGVLEAIETDLTAMSRLAAMVGQMPGNGTGVHRRVLAALPDPPSELRSDDMTLLSLELLAGAIPETSNLQPTI